MTFRTHILAGLLAAAAIPSLAHAAPYVGIGERQQLAEIGHETGTVVRDAAPAMIEHGQPMAYATRSVDIGELQRRAEIGEGARSGAGESPEFFTEHKREMDNGVTHIEASEQAARRVGVATAN